MCTEEGGEFMKGSEVLLRSIRSTQPPELPEPAQQPPVSHRAQAAAMGRERPRQQRHRRTSPARRKLGRAAVGAVAQKPRAPLAGSASPPSRSWGTQPELGPDLKRLLMAG